ncbi:MAG: signal peptidase II [Polaromonas sp.]|nr:signal peptidase II [Polaromonas sp.]MBP6088387.1 signal peptidase II [Polaromonas sp.]MBP6156343.1 signal peptidase II [Polaromonas sp.]MBP9830277.1 signal peptidase II [Polaromonas sp.]
MTNDDFYYKLKRNKTVRTLLNSRWLWITLAVLGFAADQAIKYAVTARMQLHESLPIFPSFNWVYVLNPGAAFSFLADAGGWQKYFFTIFAATVSLVLLVMLWRGVSSKVESLAYALIISGALGNAVDRVRIGAVVDYLDFYWRTWHWPAFNLADIWIVSAAMLLMLSAFQQPSISASKRIENPQ